MNVRSHEVDAHLDVPIHQSMNSLLLRADVGATGRANWEVVDTASIRRIFGRDPGREFGAAMTEALNGLLRGSCR